LAGIVGEFEADLAGLVEQNHRRSRATSSIFVIEGLSKMA